ncbi:DUF6292 family protein [Streptomyces sp. Lzd4kr]|nr:DUF6292 family protein [Streptomyces sp. Lzd4kr]
MLLDPPAWHGLWAQELPHWPYVQAVDQALTDRGITLGIVRADVALRAYHQTNRQDTIYMILIWDVSRTGARGGVRLTWEEETGWAYAKLGPSIHDVLPKPPHPAPPRLRHVGDVADVAEGLVHHDRGVPPGPGHVVGCRAPFLSGVTATGRGPWRGSPLEWGALPASRGRRTGACGISRKEVMRALADGQGLRCVQAR